MHLKYYSIAIILMWLSMVTVMCTLKSWTRFESVLAKSGIQRRKHMNMQASLQVGSDTVSFIYAYCVGRRAVGIEDIPVFAPHIRYYISGPCGQINGKTFPRRTVEMFHPDITLDELYPFKDIADIMAPTLNQFRQRQKIKHILLKLHYQVKHVSKSMELKKFLQMNSYTHQVWLLEVPEMFGLNVTIKTFKLSRSLDQCRHEFLKLAFMGKNRSIRRPWIKCGVKPPWTWLTDHHKVTLTLYTQLIRDSHFSLVYQIYDKTSVAGNYVNTLFITPTEEQNYRISLSFMQHSHTKRRDSIAYIRTIFTEQLFCSVHVKGQLVPARIRGHDGPYPLSPFLKVDQIIQTEHNGTYDILYKASTGFHATIAIELNKENSHQIITIRASSQKSLIAAVGMNVPPNGTILKTSGLDCDISSRTLLLCLYNVSSRHWTPSIPWFVSVTVLDLSVGDANTVECDHSGLQMMNHPIHTKHDSVIGYPQLICTCFIML